MLLRLLSMLLTCAPLNFAQMELLHLGGRSALEPTTYTRVVQLPNNDQLLVGTWSYTSPNPVNLQIAVGAVGPASFGFSWGGDHGNDVPNAAAIDPAGNIWIVGNSDADDFNLVNPIVSQKVPYRTAGFVLEIDPKAGKVVFATYLCGQQHSSPSVPTLLYRTEATAIAIDSAGNVYVGGSTDEPDLPTTPGAYLTKGGGADSFSNTFFYSYAVKISPAGKLIYGTFLGTGTSACQGGSACIGRESTGADVESLAVDGTGALAVAGVKNGAVNVGSGYVLRLAPDGSQVRWSSAVGTSFGSIYTLSMAQDSSGNIDLFGKYAPVKPYAGPNVPPLVGTPGLFAAKLSSDGSTMIYATDLGQSTDANAAGIALDSSGNAYLTGTSSSSQFPALAGVPNLGSDFVLRLDSSGSKAQALFRFPSGVVSAPPAFDLTGRLLLLGPTGSLLAVPSSYAFDTPAIVGYANAASYLMNAGFAPGELISLFGFDLDGSTQDVQVMIGGSPATVLYAGPTQINIQAPLQFSQSYNPQLQVVLPSRTLTLGAVSSVPSPGLLTMDGVHAAAFNQDGSVNSASNPAEKGSIVSLFGTGVPAPACGQNGIVATGAVALNQEANKLEVFDSLATPLSILYAGAAPGLVCGLVQINVQLTSSVAVPLTLRTTGNGTFGQSLASNGVEVYLK
jgi:uncharacterized protein (TIGR03437 family)